MIRFLLALVTVLLFAVAAEAHGPRVRATPFNPFRGPRVVGPVVHNDFARGFNNARSFGIRGDVLIEQTFIDRFGRVRIGLFDSRGNLVRVIR